MEVQTDIQQILNQHTAEPDSLLSILEDIHARLGYLSREAIHATAAYLKLPPAQATEAAENTGRFRFLPHGRHHIKICCGTACHVKGSRHIMNRLKSNLAIEPGECTADGRFSLEMTACQNACSTGPYVNIDDEVYLGCTCASIDDILNSLKD